MDFENVAFEGSRSKCNNFQSKFSLPSLYFSIAHFFVPCMVAVWRFDGKPLYYVIDIPPPPLSPATRHEILKNVIGYWLNL